MPTLKQSADYRAETNHLRAYLKDESRVIRGVGIAWYRNAEDFRLLMTMFEPGSVLKMTYPEWLALADEAFDRLTGEGARVVKAYLDPHPFAAWCKEHNLKLDQHARTMYAGWYAQITDTPVNPFERRVDRN